MELELRNLENIYYKQDKNKKRSVYYDPINNNLIIFTPIDKDTDIESICNSIRNSIYEYLINELNTKTNLIVSWSQVSFTTSDYDIYYDYNVNEFKYKSYKEIMKILSNTDMVTGMKYQEIKKGIASAIKFKEDKKILH
jgi:hypothetical protein